MKGEWFSELVFLTQTDTTVGFVSQSPSRLTAIKRRPPHKHYIEVLSSLAKLTSKTRVPEQYKNFVRRAKRSTFVFPSGNSYRIIHDTPHAKLIQKLGFAYSTSANLSGELYNAEFARESADVLVGFPYQREQGELQSASKIYKLGVSNIKRIR